MSKKPEASSYVLIIDKKRNHIMGALLQACMSTESGRAVFDVLCQGQITREDVKEFIDDWADKEHELGWCVDPNCKRQKQKV